MSRDLLNHGLSRMADTESPLLRLRQQWRGQSPAAFLSSSAREALDDRLRSLGVNYPRLYVSSLADRVTLSGLTWDGKQDPDLWRRFRAAGGLEVSELVHADRLLYGSAYVTVWAVPRTGRPTITGDSPLTMTHDEDPATGDVRWAVRRWTLPHNQGSAAAVYTPERITFWRNAIDDASAAGNWEQDPNRPPVDNPLDEVPVVPFIRRQSLSDPGTGASAVADIADLTDAVAKILADAMVTSEYYARPRRWATGLEIEEDEDGNAIDPFGEGRFLQSEAPETKFGQLQAAGLDAYGQMVGTLTQQIGAVTGLPPHYLGIHGDQPANPDGVKAAESQLVMRAYTEQRQLDAPWGRVAWLLDAVSRSAPAVADQQHSFGPAWANPEIKTPAQAADAAAKLRGIGVPLASVLADPMGWTDDRIRDAVGDDGAGSPLV